VETTMTNATEQKGDRKAEKFFNNSNYAKAGGWKGGGTFPPEAERPIVADQNAARTDTRIARALFRSALGG
jgi:hypothetical protein